MSIDRVFPLLFRQHDGTESSYLAELLARATGKPGVRARFFQSPEERFVSLLRTFSMGLDAERAADYSRADFYLEYAHELSASFAANSRFVEAMAARSGRQDFIQDMAAGLLESHVACLKGYLRCESAEVRQQRAPRHVGWAEHALTFTRIPDAEQSAIRGWLHEHEIAAAEAGGKPEAALAAYEQSLDRKSPISFKNRYIECLHAKTLSELSVGEVEGQRNADAAVLEAATQRLARFFDRVADSPLAYERLADLAKRRIAALVDAEDPGPRLAAFQRALDADPFDLAIQAADVQWRFALSEAQEKFRELEAEAAAEGKVLNQQGVVLRSMYTGGFAAAGAYLASAQAKTVQAGLRNLTSQRLWRLLELPFEPGWEDRAVNLADAIADALVSLDLDDPGFAGALQSAIQTRTDIAHLNARSITSCLRRVRGVSETAQAAEPAIPLLIERVASVDPTHTAAPQTAEDFADWFFSPAGTSTRWASAIASVLLLLAAGLTAYNAKVSSSRESLYPQIVTAARENRHDVVMKLAPEFLSTRPLSGRTHFDEAVRQAYAEAVVAMIAQSPGEPDATLVQAAQRYEQIVGEPKGDN